MSLFDRVVTPLDEAAPANTWGRRFVKGAASYRHARQAGHGKLASAVLGVARAAGLSGQHARTASRRQAGKEGRKP